MTAKEMLGEFQRHSIIMSVHKPQIKLRTLTVSIMINQTQLGNMQCLKYLDSLITKEAKYTRKIKFRIAIAKMTFNRKKSLFTSKLDLNLRK
jgi:hypothetical protein